MLQKTCAVIIALCVFTRPSFAYQNKPLKKDWDEHKNTHFIIYYHEDVPITYIREFSKRCEKYYDVITDRLGFNRFDFWLWENRAKIYIYKSKENYTRDTQRPFWSGGSVQIKKKIVSTFYGKEDFFVTMLPHELSHIMLREVIGHKASVPLWFDEGVACANEKDSYLKYFVKAKIFTERNVSMTVSELERIADSTELIVPSVFYAVSAALVIFLLEDYKKEKFVEFCKALGDRVKFYEAMEKSYDIKNPEELNDKFLLFLKNKKHEDIVNSNDYNVDW